LNKKRSPPISQLYIRRRNHYIHLRSSYDHTVHITDGTKWKKYRRTEGFREISSNDSKGITRNRYAKQRQQWKHLIPSGATGFSLLQTV